MPKVTTPRSTRNSLGLRPRTYSVSSVDSDSDGSSVSGRAGKRKKTSHLAERIATDVFTDTSIDHHDTSVARRSSSDIDFSTFETSPGNNALPTISEEVFEPATPAAQIHHQPPTNTRWSSTGVLGLSPHSPIISPVEVAFGQVSNPTTPPAQNSGQLCNNITPSPAPNPNAPKSWEFDSPQTKRRLEDFELLAEEERLNKELQETPRFLLQQAKEGDRFARELYCAIRQDHKLRNCTCGSPTIYKSKEEAEAGRGHFRFYVVDSNPQNLRVIQRKDDLEWHCHCSREILYSYQSKKRPAEDTEIDLIAQNNGRDDHTGTIETIRAAVTEDRTVGEVKVQSMWGYLASVSSRVSASMGASIYNFLGKLRARVSDAFDIVESRTLDTTSNSISVKRLKRQHCISLEDTSVPRPEASRVEDLPWFEWANDATSHIGCKEYVLGVLAPLERQAKSWTTGRVQTMDAIEEFKAHPFHAHHGADPSDLALANIDEDLSQSIHQLMKTREKAGLPGGWDEALQIYGQGVTSAVSFIKMLYLDNGLLPRLREAYPHPPAHLFLRRFIKVDPEDDSEDQIKDHYSASFEQRIRKAGEFLIYLLTPESPYKMEDEWREIVSKIIVDANSVHKNEMPPSLVVFPAKRMPGSFPDGLIEDVCMDDFTIEAPFEVRFPSSKSPNKTEPLPAKEEFRKAKERKYIPRPKGVLKVPRRRFPEYLYSPHGQAVTPKQRKKKLTFRSPVGEFVPPTHIPICGKEQDMLRAGQAIATHDYWADVMAKEEERKALQMALETREDEERLAEEKKAEEEHLVLGKKTKTEHLALEPGWEESTDEAEMDSRTGIESQTRPAFAFPTSAVDSTDWTESAYARFLAGTREDMRKHARFSTGSLRRKSSQQTRTAGLGDEVARRMREVDARKREKFKEPLPPPPQPDPRSAEERRRRLELLVNDLELNERGEVVPRQVSSVLLDAETDLIIATKKLDDLDLAHQLREEMQAAEAQRLKEVQQKLEAEEKRKQERERYLLEKEQRRRERQERYRKEEELRRQQEAQRRLEAEERARLSGLRHPTRSIVSPIPPEWDAKVTQIARANPDVELTKTPEGQALTRRDFAEKLLPATAWLNDNIIIGAILYIADFVNTKAGTSDQDPKCAAFTSYFWPRLRDAGVDKCARLMRRAGVRKNNFLKIETILIPICSSSHWTLAVVRPGQRTVAHMDSMRGGAGDRAVTAKLLEWIKVTLEEEYVAEEWKVIDYEAPRQTNGYDCGVFAITNAQCLALGLDPKATYTANQLTLQRRRLAAVLLNGGFKGEFDMGGI